MDQGLLMNHSAERLHRIDTNLSILREKIDEAERVDGKTRSHLLNLLSPEDTMRPPLLDVRESDLKFVVGDLMAVQKLLERISLRILGRSEKDISKKRKHLLVD